MKKLNLLFIASLFLISCTGCAEEQQDDVAENEEIQEHHEIIITSSSPEIKLKNVEITEGDSFKDSDCIEEIADNLQYTVIGTVNKDDPGTYKLRFTVTDDYGNVSSKTATVNVKEKPAPVQQPEVAYVPSAPAYQPTYQQPTYQQPTYQEPVYQEPVYSGGGASGSSSADATSGQSAVGGMSWGACQAEVSARNAADPSHTHACVQIVGTNSYYVVDY